MDFKHIISEFGKTFSNQKSFLSSKRIERFVIFSTMLGITLFFLIKNTIKCELNATDFAIVIGLWMGYAGFNTVQIKKDSNDTSESSKESI